MVEAEDDNILSYLSDDKAVRRFVKQMLKNHIFVGNFIEQRFVDQFNCYKKIVQISRNEDIFIENLYVVRRRLERYFSGTKWIGITFPDTPGAPVGFNLWVEMEEQIFGTYNFRVKDVEFLDDQISLKLQTMITNKKQSSKDFSFNHINQSNFTHGLVCEDLATGTADVPIISWRNLKEFSIFMFLFLATVITGGGQIVMFLMDFSLKLMRELSNIFSIITPILIACLDTLSKMFGYVCFLIASMWRDRHSPPKGLLYSPNGGMFYPHKIQYQLGHGYGNSYKALSYKPRSSVEITELPD